jgi:hypothetical protein
MASRVKKCKKTTRRSRKGGKKTMKMRSKRGGGKRGYDTITETEGETMQQCKRRQKPTLIEKKTLTTKLGRTGHRATDPNKIYEFVKEDIKDGPQIVEFPMQPYSHSILVDVQPENERIMISDWILLTGRDAVTGLRSLKERFDDTTDEEEVLKHQDYKHILELLKEKYYDYKIIYYPVDMKMKDIIWDSLDEKKQGGCSIYLYDWIDTYYPYGYYNGPPISERRGNVYYDPSL